MQAMSTTARYVQTREALMLRSQTTEATLEDVPIQTHGVRNPSKLAHRTTVRERTSGLTRVRVPNDNLLIQRAGGAHRHDVAESDGFDGFRVRHERRQNFPSRRAHQSSGVVFAPGDG